MSKESQDVNDEVKEATFAFSGTEKLTRYTYVLLNLTEDGMKAFREKCNAEKIVDFDFTCDGERKEFTYSELKKLLGFKQTDTEAITDIKELLRLTYLAEHAWDIEDFNSQQRLNEKYNKEPPGMP